MKGLEALKELKENRRKHWLDGIPAEELLGIVEKELTALEIIRKKCAPLLKNYMLDQLPKEESKLVEEVLCEKEQKI